MINYQKVLDDTLEKLDLKKKNTLLLHSCCGPCSSYCIEYLANYFDITVLYYNPNISPKEEYEYRKKEQIRLIHELKINHKVDFMDCDYDNEKYNQAICGFENEQEGGKRCSICFHLRLEKTAILAKENQYDYFATTLTVSPYKNSQRINMIGNRLSHQYQVKYLFSDFKKKNGYKRSIELSKQYNLYRQDYCGCIYSKKERERVKYEQEIL